MEGGGPPPVLQRDKKPSAYRVKKLVNGKSTSIHNIPNKVLKDSIDMIAPMLRDIFKLSIMTSSFANELKILKVVAVHKAIDKEDPNNYRPVAILSTIAPVFEKLIYGQLYNYFTENNLFYWAINSLALDHYIQLLLLLVNQWIID